MLKWIRRVFQFFFKKKFDIADIPEGYSKTQEKYIKKIKNHTADAIVWIHGITFTFYYIAEAILNHFLSERLPNGVWGQVIRLLFAGFGYLGLYFFIKGLHSLKLKWFKSKFKITGKWYHVHIPMNIDGSFDYSRKYLSAGTTTVGRDINDFTFVGDNYDFYINDNGAVCVQKDSNRHTLWQTETSELVEGDNNTDIIEVYRANTTGHQQTVPITKCPVCKSGFEEGIEITLAPGIRYGIHKYRIIPGNKEIVCDYTDCWPSLKSGQLFLFRDPRERNKKIQEYFKEASSKKKVDDRDILYSRK